MNFEPKTKAQLDEIMLMAKGEYDFEVLFAQDTVSKNRNPMIKLQLGIYDSTGKMRKLYDYLVPSMEVKLQHFCDSTGLLPQYQSGTLKADMCVGRSGRCKLDIEPEQSGYPAKNCVRDYCIRKAKPIGEAAQVPSQEVVDDTDVPF